jgi:hypothetical protein
MFKIKKVRPLFTGIVTTATRYVGDTINKAGLIVPNKMEGQLNPFQRVVSVGKMVNDIKEGDIVKLNFKRYLVPLQVPGKIEDNVQSSNMKGTYEIPMIDLDGVPHLFLQSNDVEFVIEDCEIDEGGLLQ